ncbi:MAG: hypothetical protein GC200_01055 [Tepidisphaera sp.]|nr:hypothetical protein [Tepidisphaera sp.]
MKLKGINFFEANADKIVLGVTGLTFLGVIAMQFLSGNYIKVGSDDKLTAGNAFRPVEEEANKLAAKLKSESPKLPDVPAFTLTEKLQGLAGQPLGDGGVRVALGVPPMIQMAPRDATIAAATYELPKVPAPGPAVAAPYAATVSPVEVVAHPELAAILPKEQPFDKMIVSVESTFDGAALREALQADPDGDGPREALPLAWWRDPADQGDDLVTIVGIEAERELLRNPDGTTPAAPEVTMVQAAPARPDGLKTWQQGVRSLGDVPPTILTLRSEMDQILRPSFYQTIAGPAWTSPSDYVAQGDQNEKARLVKRKREALAATDKKITQVQELISKAPDPGAKRSEQPSSPPPGRGGGGGGRGRAGGGGQGGGPAPSSPTPQPTGDRRVLEARLKTLQAQRENLVKDLGKLGEHVEGAAGADISLAQGPQPGLLEGGEQKFWVHDVNAVPGAVYRYHVRVVINNPLFGRNLQDSQRQMADGSLIRSDWSEWTAPVQVDQTQVMFVSSASEAGQIDPRPHASVELYQFYYGYYRQALAGLDPGEPAIGKATLPELKLADMNKLATMYKAGDPALGAMPEQAAPPPEPIGRRGVVGEGGPGRGKTGGGSYEGPGGQVPPATPATPESPKFPAWMDVDAPKSLPLGGDMVFLDAGTVPLSPGDAPGSTQGVEALFRNPTGLLIVRRPDKESQEPYLARVRASANAGKTQGVEIKPIEVPKQVPVRDDRRRGPSGSGGGGGGGGG